MTSKTYGVMFKAEMILAYLAGLKTQTRRLHGLKHINQEPDLWTLRGIGNGLALFQHKENQKYLAPARLPYGDEACTLWFRETWRELIDLGPGTNSSHNYVDYRADHHNDVLPDLNVDVKWKSSMLMPHWASRFQDIPITRVRVERLQSITAADAFAEGVRDTYLHQIPDWMDVDSYAELWNEINGKTFPWQSNPWVFVYEFPKYNKEKQ